MQLCTYTIVRLTVTVLWQLMVVWVLPTLAGIAMVVLFMHHRPYCTCLNVTCIIIFRGVDAIFCIPRFTGLTGVLFTSTLLFVV